MHQIHTHSLFECCITCNGSHCTALYIVYHLTITLKHTALNCVTSLTKYQSMKTTLIVANGCAAPTSQVGMYITSLQGLWFWRKMIHKRIRIAPTHIFFFFFRFLGVWCKVPDSFLTLWEMSPPTLQWLICCHLLNWLPTILIIDDLKCFQLAN